MKKLIFLSLIALIGCNNNKDKSDAYGTFEATEITISAETTGKIIVCSAEEGEEVKKGDLLLVCDTTDLYLKMQQLKAQRSGIASKSQSILSQVNIYKQQKDNLIVEKNRVEKLLKENAATQKQLDDINGNISLIEKQIASVETQNVTALDELKAMEMQIMQLNENIRKSYIHSPIDATILTKYSEIGEMIIPAKALFRLADLNIIYLRVYVSGKQLSQIKLGQNVKVLIDDYSTDKTNYEGGISWISSSAEFTPKILQTKEERVNLVYAVKVRVKNDGKIKIGMPGEIKL